MLTPGISTREDVIMLLMRAISDKVNQVRASTVTGNDSAERQISEIMLQTLTNNGICLREAPFIPSNTVSSDPDTDWVESVSDDDGDDYPES